jgi:hypothetical protein
VIPVRLRLRTPLVRGVDVPLVSVVEELRGLVEHGMVREARRALPTVSRPAGRHLGDSLLAQGVWRTARQLPPPRQATFALTRSGAPLHHLHVLVREATDAEDARG